MAIIVEDGTGKVDAASYVSVAEADAYFSAHLYGTGWTGATTQQKEAALVMATRGIDAGMEFKGSQIGLGQALEWPRVGVVIPGERMDGEPVSIVTGSENVRRGQALEIPPNVIPRRLKDAVCEFSRFLLAGDRDAAADTAAVKREKVDVIEVEYSTGSRPDIIPESVLRMLRPFALVASDREASRAPAQAAQLLRR